MQAYPLEFEPLLKQTIWGGRRLETKLNKKLGSAEDYAESWEIVDHGVDQSVVCNGELAGQTLKQIITADKTFIFGVNQQPTDFPLLLKYLDCNRVLSVQVHPDDSYALRMVPPDLGKTEAWYIVESEPESLVYAGLKSGVTKRDLVEALENGEAEKVLHAFHPDAGDVIYIPAGTVHALGQVYWLLKFNNPATRHSDSMIGTESTGREIPVNYIFKKAWKLRTSIEAPSFRDPLKKTSRIGNKWFAVTSLF